MTFHLTFALWLVYLSNSHFCHCSSDIVHLSGVEENFQVDLQQRTSWHFLGSCRCSKIWPAKQVAFSSKIPFDYLVTVFFFCFRCQNSILRQNSFTLVCNLYSLTQFKKKKHIHCFSLSNWNVWHFNCIFPYTMNKQASGCVQLMCKSRLQISKELPLWIKTSKPFNCPITKANIWSCFSIHLIC